MEDMRSVATPAQEEDLTLEEVQFKAGKQFYF